MQRAITDAFPYPVVRVPGAAALETWERMRSAPGTPIVLGGEEDFLRVAETLSMLPEFGKTPSSILAEAAGYSFPEAYQARLQRDRAEFEAQYRTDPRTQEFVDSLAPAGMDMDAEPSRGPWPLQPPENPGLSVKDELIVTSNSYMTRPYDEVIIATVPTEDWTEAFAYLGFGGWNACPYPHEHIAAFRYWNAKYDLVLAGLSGDVLNIRAGRRPASREEALALALEQYEFCPDLVDQGVGTLEALAAGLMANDWWYFWWD